MSADPWRRSPPMKARLLLAGLALLALGCGRSGPREACCYCAEEAAYAANLAAVAA